MRLALRYPCSEIAWFRNLLHDFGYARGMGIMARCLVVSPMFPLTPLCHHPCPLGMWPRAAQVKQKWPGSTPATLQKQEPPMVFAAKAIGVQRTPMGYSHSMVGVADSCSNSIMSYHLVIRCPASAEHSQYRFELTRFAIYGLSMRE